VQSIRCWLECMGRKRYPHARELTITADCGGSNGARVRLWKRELQKLADETGLVIRVHHYPPGTSKWNKIEHRLFCHITQNWRGRPLTDRLAVVELIGATATKTGLRVESALDTRNYQKGIKISKAAMKCLDIIGDHAALARETCCQRRADHAATARLGTALSRRCVKATMDRSGPQQVRASPWPRTR
jgi:Rhodopirellula transposase DDE domain